MLRVQFAVAPEAEELASALLWMAGCQGVTSAGSGVLAARMVIPPDTVLLEAFFDGPPDLGALEAAGFIPLQTLDEPPTDWLAAWRLAARPIEIGERLLIEPGEPDEVIAELWREGRRRILVPARAAFGTGSHETTRLMLDALDRRPPVGERVLDVGCGSGILSFVALALGASSAMGFELDLESALLAGVNARLNRYRVGFWAGTLDALNGQEQRARFDLVLVNVLPERILDRAAELSQLVATGGRLLYAGHLVEREADIVAAWAAVGLSPRGRATLGDWGLLELEPR